MIWAESAVDWRNEGDHGKTDTILPQMYVDKGDAGKGTDQAGGLHRQHSRGGQGISPGA